MAGYVAELGKETAGGAPGFSMSRRAALRKRPFLEVYDLAMYPGSFIGQRLPKRAARGFCSDQ